MILLYAVIACISCKKKRVIDLSAKSSACPYCGVKSEHRTLQILFKSNDAKLCRAAQNQITGFTPQAEKKQASRDVDPYSTLEYEYEHCHSLEEKMSTLSEGLTRVYGEFTFEDLEKLEPKNAEKMLKAMLVNGYIHETKYGRYTA